MPQQGLRELQAAGALVHQRRRGVAEQMKPGPPSHARNARPLECGIEHLRELVQQAYAEHETAETVPQ